MALVVMILAGCNNRSISTRLSEIDSLFTAEQSDTVLNKAEQQNADYDSITDVELIHQAVLFYNVRGTANQQVRANYLLGCAYRDMGDAPQALEYYQDAVNSADTSQNDCDYRQLAKVHSQMAALFYEQLLPYEQLEELDNQYHCAMLANNIKSAINAVEHRAGAYELLNMPDSVITIRLRAHQLYKENGFDQEAAAALGPAIRMLIEENKIEEARHYIEIYESESGILENGQVDNNRAIYYYIKGNYYLALDQMDSAKSMYIKLLAPELTANHHEAGSRGLYLLYKKVGEKDSMAKYADLAYQLNDESYSSAATEKMQKMQSLYNYNRSHSEIVKTQEKAEYSKQLLLVILTFTLLGITMIIYIYRKKHRTMERERDEAMSQIDELESRQAQNKDEIIRLEEVRQTAQLETRELEDRMVAWQGKEVQRIRRGIVLYDAVERNEKVLTWTADDYQAFIDYYETAHYEVVSRLRKRYGEPTHRNMLYLLLVDMGKTNEEISQIMSLDKDSIRSIRYRLNNTKKKK